MLAAAGLVRLKIDFSFQAMIGSDDPAYAHFGTVFNRVEGDEKIFFVLAESQTGTVLEPARLKALKALSVDLQKLDVVADATSLAGFPMPQEGTGEIVFEPILEAVPGDTEARATWQKNLLKEKTLVPNILSADGKSR